MPEATRILGHAAAGRAQGFPAAGFSGAPMVLTLLDTLRFKLIRRAAVLLRPNAKTTLPLGCSPTVASHFIAVAHTFRA